MKTKKAGCILININNKHVGLVYRKKLNDYSFPKGHLEENETLEECAIREVEEETGELCHIIATLKKIHYTTGSNEKVEVQFYLAVADGKSSKIIPMEDQEKLIWKPFDEVEDTLSYEDLKEYWCESEKSINSLLSKI